jgi:hypothetical protein
MFNTLKYAKILEEVGFSREQSETAIKILVEIMEDKLASKQDLKDLDAKMDNRFAQFEIKLDHALAQIESKFTATESRLTIRMGTMLAASIAILTAIQKLV